MTISVGDTVKVIKDNYQDDNIDSLLTYGVNVGDCGTVLSTGDEELPFIKENLIVEFNSLDGKIITLCLAEDEVEKHMSKILEG